MSRRAFLIILFIGALLIPFSTAVVPEWKLTVKDYSGNLLSGEPVREMWRHYSLESKENVEESITDYNGQVVFPERRIWASLYKRILFYGLAQYKSLIHQGELSLGGEAWITVPKYSNNGGNLFFQPDNPLPQQINVRR